MKKERITFKLNEPSNKYSEQRQSKKTLLKIIIVSMIALLSVVCSSGCINQDNLTIKISGAFALYPMMGIWAEEYIKIHPELKIDISAGGAGKGMSDAIMELVDIGMVSRGIYQSEIDQGIFWISVAKDAVVATINSENPVLDDILLNGLSKQQLEDIFVNRNIQTWGELVDDPSNTDPIRVYTRSDACGAAQTWALYLGDYTQDDLTNVADSAINGDPNLAAAIQGDELGIGYNNINFIYNPSTEKPFDNLIPVPIDLNENGILDNNESFYTSRTTMTNAIAENMYPSPPARALHLVTKTNFTGKTKEFVYWILTDGQSYVSESGYIQLSEELINQQVQFLETGIRSEEP